MSELVVWASRKGCLCSVDYFVCFQGKCDPEIIAAKLDLYSSSCPHASQIANYWLCRARIAQQEKDFDRVVCLLEQAFAFKAQVIQLFFHPFMSISSPTCCHQVGSCYSSAVFDAILFEGRSAKTGLFPANTFICFLLDFLKENLWLTFCFGKKLHLVFFLVAM